MIGSISYVTCYFVCFKQCPPAYYFHHFIDADSPLYDAHSPSGTIFDHVFALAGPDAPPHQKRNLPVGVNLTPAVMEEALPNIHQHIDRSLYVPFLMRATCVARESDASSGGGGSAGQTMCASCIFALPDVIPNCTLADCLEGGGGSSATKVNLDKFHTAVPLPTPASAPDSASDSASDSEFE